MKNKFLNVLVFITAPIWVSVVCGYVSIKLFKFFIDYYFWYKITFRRDAQ